MDPSVLQLTFIISLLLLIIILLSSIKICKVQTDKRKFGLNFIDKDYNIIAENFANTNINPLMDVVIQSEEKLVKQSADQEMQNIRLRALDARITNAENVAKSLQLL
jgi:hypothetical protein